VQQEKTVKQVRQFRGRNFLQQSFGQQAKEVLRVGLRQGGGKRRQGRHWAEARLAASRSLRQGGGKARVLAQEARRRQGEVFLQDFGVACCWAQAHRGALWVSLGRFGPLARDPRPAALWA
jgi:hypothetical protein